jgi:L-ascorbate metabolism protein UlaG (beta-lactamase superfamily)
MKRDLADATFRRAEGLRIHGSACEGFAEFRVAAHREGGGTEAIVSRDEAALLCRLNRWQTASEARATLEVIEPLVDADFVFFAHGRPRRDLSGAAIPSSSDGPIALRRNVSFTPLVASEEDPEPRPIPFMPRRGELEGLALVGFEFAVNEMETETHSIALACCAQHGRLLRDLLPRLTGASRGADLVTDHAAKPFLEALTMLGLLESRTASIRARDDAAHVTWLCHAAVLIETGGRRVLVDPLEYPCSIPSRHAMLPPDWRDIGVVDAILVTHGDNDHLNPRTLCRLARETPVYIPAPPSIEPYQVDMEALLTLLGFERVTSLREWDRFALGDVTVVATPFRGEDWGLTLASVTYVVASPTLTIYLDADSTSTPDAYDRLASEFAIDLACVGVTGASEAHVMPPGYGYGHFYAPWIPDERRNEWVQLCNGPEESAEVARRLKARFAFGYAAGGAPFAAQAYTDRGTHADLAAILARDADGPEPIDLPLGKAVRLGRDDVARSSGSRPPMP